MKRRLYRDHETGWEDATTWWSIWSIDGEYQEPLPILDNEGLWFEYEAARAKVRELHQRITEKVRRGVPWSPEELRLGKEAMAILDSDNYDVKRIAEIEAELLKNANE